MRDAAEVRRRGLGRRARVALVAALLAASVGIAGASGSAQGSPCPDCGGGGGDGGTDTTPPTVTSVAPPEGAVRVDPFGNVSAVFSEPMSPSTITTSTFTLTRADTGGPVAATVSYDFASRTATLDPAAPLGSLARYTATVTPGATDAEGNALDQDATAAGQQSESWTFDIRDYVPPQVSNLAPTSGTYRGGITLSASASDDSGAVSKVEFRVRDVLVGTDTSPPFSFPFASGDVSDGPAAVRATAFDAAGLSADVESQFTLDNTLPELSVTNPLNGESFGPNSTQTWIFETSDTTSGLESVRCSVVPTGQPDLFATCTGSGAHSVSDRPDGVYRFAVRARDAAGNEVVRTDSFTVDATAPVVRTGGITPFKGAKNVARDTIISAAFSEAIDPDSLNAGTFEVRQYDAKKRKWRTVRAEVSLADGGTVATLRPATSLKPKTKVKATLATGVEDPAGNALARAYSWTFTTGR